MELGMRTGLCIGLLLTLSILTACSSGAAGGSNVTSSSNSTPTISSIQVSPASMAIGVGRSQQFQASAHMSDGSTKDVTSSVNWGSSDSSIASISGAGIATASGAGSVTITAQAGSLTATAVLTVTAAAANLSSITISPTASSIPVNTS